jgi:hypothetical protein
MASHNGTLPNFLADFLDFGFKKGVQRRSLSLTPDTDAMKIKSDLRDFQPRQAAGAVSFPKKEVPAFSAGW